MIVFFYLFGHCTKFAGNTSVQASIQASVVQIISKKLLISVKNYTTFIYAKFGADLVITSKVTSCKTKFSRFLAYPV